MRAIVRDYHTDIFLSRKEFEEYCKPGEGANTCSWLIAGPKGFQCCYYHRPDSIIKRRAEGTIVAMRDGCDKVINFDPGSPGECTVTF